MVGESFTREWSTEGAGEEEKGREKRRGEEREEGRYREEEKRLMKDMS